MPIARIIARSSENAAQVAERLRAEGYTVETVLPGDRCATAADLEIRIDECATEEALVMAAQMARDGGRILVAPGAITAAGNPTPVSQMWGATTSGEADAGTAAGPGIAVTSVENAPAVEPTARTEESVSAPETSGALGTLASWWKRRVQRKRETAADVPQLAPTFTDIEPAPVQNQTFAGITGDTNVESYVEAEQERARLAAEQERARSAELQRQAEAERIRLAEEASRIAREQELERQRRQAERERLEREAEAERLRQEAELRRLREQEERDRLQRLAEAAEARAAAQRELEERRRAEAERLAAIEAQRRAEEQREVVRSENLHPSLRSGWGTRSTGSARDAHRRFVSSQKPRTPRLPKPRRPSQLGRRQREWRLAIVVAAVFAILLMLGWSAIQNPRPAAPLSNSDLTKSSTIKQEVPFGPVTMPPAVVPHAAPTEGVVAKPAPKPPAAQPPAKAKPTAMKRTMRHRSRRGQSQSESAAEDDVTVRRFGTAPQPSRSSRGSQELLKRYSDE